LATWHSFPSVTARLFVRYRRPVPINTELLITARLVDVHGRRLHVDARITDGDEPLAEAKVALLHVPFEHFLSTPEGRAAADRWSAQHGTNTAETGDEQSGGTRAVE
jgi:acyl-CoA thioesterase FadM